MLSYLDINLALVLFIAIITSAFATRIWILALEKHDIGQPIRKEGNKEHYKKQGTPTMGGVAFTLVALVLALVFVGLNKEIILILIGCLGFAGIGFLDDREKVSKKENEGLTPKQKLILQSLLGLIMVIYAILVLDIDYTSQIIPILNVRVNLGVLAIVLLVFIIVGTTNAANLTDGLDGLLSGVSIPIFFTLAIIAFKIEYLSPSLGITALIFAGVLLGYLFFNSNPASVMMGDTGSMAIGGAICAILLAMNLLPYLILLAGVFFIEALSVLIQTFYFRRTGGKRIFLMSPIHHHFELKGYKEQKITTSFSIISILLCLVSLMVI